MITAKTDTKNSLIGAEISKVDAASLKLHNLTEIMHLAAFAAEARRTLSEIRNVKRREPEVQTAINLRVEHSDAWADMHDNTGDVLTYIAHQLREVNGVFTESAYALREAASEFSEAKNSSAPVSVMKRAARGGR